MISGQGNEGLKPLLIGIGGGGVDIASQADVSPDYDLLYLDTDRRTGKKVPGREFLLVGGSVVNGEGAGSNMNLARACFRKDMEILAVRLIGRPLVVLISSAEGATGLAGSVEICTLLSRVNAPTLSFIALRDGIRSGGMDPASISRVLLKGPLRPGCLVPFEPAGQRGAVTSQEELLEAVHVILSCTSARASLQIPNTSWARMREFEGTYRTDILHLSGAPLERGDLEIREGGPVLACFGTGSEVSVDRVRSMVQGLLEGRPDVYLGLSPIEGPGERTIAVVLSDAGPLQGAAQEVQGAEPSQGPSGQHVPVFEGRIWDERPNREVIP